MNNHNWMPSLGDSIDVSTIYANPSFTFDSFVIGNTNFVAYNAAKYIAEHLGTEHTPLVICGPSGVGKTHLLHAISNAIAANQPYLKTILVTAENFFYLFIEFLKKGDSELFRKTFRNIDVLLIDDIHFLENKEGTGSEFFHLFDDLIRMGKQIVITSNTLPKDMEFEDNLKARLESGLLVTIEQANLDIRIGILKNILKKEQEKGGNFTIDCEVIQYIALNFDKNTRRLQGAITRLLFIAFMEGRTETIDLNYAKKILQPILLPLDE